MIWCWVKDLRTKHRFDIPLSRLDHLEAIGAVREIPGRRRRAPTPRQPKHFRRLGAGGGGPANGSADNFKEES